MLRCVVCLVLGVSYCVMLCCVVVALYYVVLGVLCVLCGALYCIVLCVVALSCVVLTTVREPKLQCFMFLPCERLHK